MGDLYLYFLAVLAHWWPLVSAGGLWGIEPFAEHGWAWLNTQIKKIPDDRRRKLKIISLIAAALLSGFLAWRDEHNARLAAERAMSENTKILARTLSYDDLGLKIKNNDKGAVIDGLSGRISNFGQDSIMVKINTMVMYVDGAKIFNEAIATEPYMSPNHGVEFGNVFFHPEISIPGQAKNIIQEWFIDYDTASPSGIRHSYRKVRYALTWTNGKCSAGRGVIIETREN